MNPSFDTNDVLLASANSVAAFRNGEARPSCIVCLAEIADNHWFCRLPQNGHGESNLGSLHLLLCCPGCALRHFDSLHPRGDGFDPDNHQFERSVHLIVDGEKPPWL